MNMDTDMEPNASAASGSVPINSDTNSEFLEVKNEINVVNSMNDNKNTYGSDFGSETDEGFMSGGEDFETDSVSGKAAVVDPDDETVAKVSYNAAVDIPVPGSSEILMSEGVRPIAKVSMYDDDDDEENEVVERGSEDEGLGGKVFKDSSDKTENLGDESLNLEDDLVGLVQTKSAEDKSVNGIVGENVEVSPDGGRKKVEDEKLEGIVNFQFEGGLASEQYEVEKTNVMDEKSIKQQSDDSLNDRHQKAPMEDDNAEVKTVNDIVGENMEASANGGKKEVEDEKLEGIVNFQFEGGLGSEQYEVEKTNVMDENSLKLQTDDSLNDRHQKAPMEDDNWEAKTVNDIVDENVEASADGGKKEVGDGKLEGNVIFEFEGGLPSEQYEVEKTNVMDEKSLKQQSDDSLNDSHQKAPMEDENAGGTVIGNTAPSVANDDVESAEEEKLDGLSSVPDDVKLTSEGDSIVENVKDDISEPGVAVVGDVKDTRDLDIRGLEKDCVPSVPSDDVKLTYEGDSANADVKVNSTESGVAVNGDVKDTRDLETQAVEVPANGFNEEVHGEIAVNVVDLSMEKNGNLGSQTGKVEMSGEEILGSFVDKQNGDGETEISEAETRDSVFGMDNDQMQSDGLNRVVEVQPRESEVTASAVPDNGSLSLDGVSNMNPVADEGESKSTGEYGASENMGPSSIIATDGEGKYADEEIEDSTTDGETEGMIFENSEAAKQFLEELEKASGVGSFSTMEDSRGLPQKIDGQIVTDSDEEVDTDEEGESKELFDPAALAALLKAARGTGGDGGSVTITSQDGSRLFSADRPAGLGSSLQSVKPGQRPSRGSIFGPSSLGVEADSASNVSEEEKKKLENLQQVRIKFLRLVQRLGFTAEESMVAQVLYRLTLVSGRQTGGLFSLDTAKRTASELEAESRDDLNLALNILVLGKAGVGKSATINSIFGETKTQIDAHVPATCGVREIIGVVGGVKLRVLDTPGLKSSAMEQSLNRKILSSVKNFTKKCPPDIILYVDRLDMQTRDLNDLPLMRSITGILGPSIWRNAIVVLTHAASAPPDGPTGSPLSYDVFVAQRSHVVQQTIGQAVGDLRLMNASLMNPVSLAENHPSCRKNRDGEKVLPNGQSWRPQLLLLCFSMKILSEASSLSKPKDPFDHKKLFGFRVRSPPLPYLLSWLLQSRTHPKLSADQGGDNGDSDIDMADLSDSDDDEDGDEYDQLPAFKPLRKSQMVKLSREQKKAYFDEYEYRVKLLQKKQWREELKRMKEMKKKGKASGDDYVEAEDGDEGPASVPVPLPDMVLPPSFDGDNTAYRYRFLEPTSQFLTRPVLDTHGWDHDCGYDGVNLEHSLAVASQFPAAYAVQITKDKKDFNIHLDSSVAIKHGENGSTMAGFDIQNIGKQLAYIVRGETKIKNFKRNKTAAGLSLTFLGENVSTGVKVEDQIAIGKRLVLVGSTGTVRSQGDAAYGANMEVRIREADYPIGQDQSSLGLSLVKWRGDLALGANLQSQFSIGRSYKMAVRAGLNNKLSGQITVKTSSSDQLQIALVALLPIAKTIYKNFWPGASENYSIY